MTYLDIYQAVAEVQVRMANIPKDPSNKETYSYYRESWNLVIQGSKQSRH